MDIIDNKIYIQENRTEETFQDEFDTFGILPKEVVLGFYPPTENPKEEELRFT